MWRNLFSRQPVLAAYSLIMMAGLVTMLVLQALDPRQLDGVNVWVKPAKFFLSIGVYSLTLGWFFGYVRDDRRDSGPMRFVIWATVILSSFELFWITWQAGHGVRSHFNTTSTLAIVMYSLMGVGIVTAITALPVMGWEIVRRPVAGLRKDYAATVVIGLVLSFILGGGLGGYTSSQITGHSVGLDGGHFPIFGWNRQGGDLRVAHFFGIHIMQALPMLMAVAAPLPRALRWLILAAGVIISLGLSLFTFVQALNGQPFLPGI